MKRVILVLILQIIAFCTFAQKSAEPNLGAIKVEQSFSVFRHCTGEKNKPVLKTMNLNIQEVENSLKDSANYSGYFDINEFYDSVYQPSFALKMSLYAGNMRHNNDCEYILDSTPGSHTSDEYERRSACGMRGAHEGYRTQTKYTIDDPIILVCNNMDMVGSLCIEEKQKIELQFSNFYTTNTTETKLEYCIGQEGDDWKKIDIAVVPGGYVKIGYEDIFGEYTNDNDDYLNNAGEILRIRAVKKLINGKWSSSDVISGIRFYHRGPDFEIEEIRRTACDEGGIIINVNIDSDLGLYTLCGKPNFNWVVVCSANAEFEEIDNGENIAVKGFSLNKDGSFKLNHETPLEEEKVEGKWLIIQFQVVGDNGVPISDLEFQKRWFQIPPKPTPVNFKQSEEAYLFEKDNVKYHLGSTVAPYVVIEPDIVPETSCNNKCLLTDNKYTATFITKVSTFID